MWLELMTDKLHSHEIDASEYSTGFLATLNNPSRLWHITFRNHTNARSRNQLYKLFFYEEFGEDSPGGAGRKYGIKLTMIFQSLAQMREAYGGRDATSKWFESTLRISFSAINDTDTADYISKRCGDTTVEGRSDQSFDRNERIVAVTLKATQPPPTDPAA